MRLTSTPQSIAAGEISVLALAETAAVSVAAAWLVYVQQTASMLALGILLAPAFLLRTERSIALGTAVYSRVATSMDRNLSLIGGRPYRGNRFLEHSMNASIVLMPRAVAWHIPTTFAILVRFWTTLRCMARHPLEGLRELPANWRRLVLCTDTATPPEFIPGLAQSGLKLKTLPVTWSPRERLLQLYDARPRSWSGAIMMLAFIPLLTFVAFAEVTIYAVPFAFRLMMKSSAIAWSPLLWIAGNITTTDPLLYRLDIITSSSFYRAVRVYSAAVICIFLATLLAWPEIRQSLESTNSPSLTTLSELFAPASLPIWHIAMLANATIALAMGVYASHAAVAARHGRLDEKRADRFLRWTSTMRTALTCYVLAVEAWFLWPLATQLTIDIDWRFIPW